MSGFDVLDFGKAKANKAFSPMDADALVLKMKSKWRIKFNFSKEAEKVAFLMGNGPTKEEVFKAVTIGGGFSSLGIIDRVAEIGIIDELEVSTFRIGKAHFQNLLNLYESGRIKKALFVTSDTQKRVDSKIQYKGKAYAYCDFISSKCAEIGWKLVTADNHSKVILMKQGGNRFVVETSSNLNENPKMEQFSWENDEELYEWHKRILEALAK